MTFRLRTPARPGRPPSSPRRALTTEPGYRNRRGQLVVAATGAASTTMDGQRIYRLKCTGCGHEYGANGCDIHIRLCPRCQNGAPGEPVLQPQPTLFG